MRNLTKKGFLNKLIIVFLVIIVFNAVIPMNKSQATVGGVLLKPVNSLVLKLADGVVDLIHKVIFGSSTALLEYDINNNWKILVVVGAVIIGILVAVAVATIMPIAAASLGSFAEAFGLSTVASLITTKVAIGTILKIGTGAAIAAMYLGTSWFGDTAVFPLYKISPQEIFEGKIEFLNANFFNTSGSNENDDSVVSEKTIVNSLKSTIAKWYYTLRNIAIVGMLLELVYIGIRIMLCSIASEKAKYKNMLEDWIVAICLIFIMQYIMAFANSLVDEFVKLVDSIGEEKGYIVYIKDESGDLEEKLRDSLTTADNSTPTITRATDDNSVIVWDAGNLMGLARVQAQLQGNEVPGVWYIGYTIAFVVLVMYTVFFLFTYLRRIVYLAFLTLIAPMVAFTYPIDKVNDGKAQAFDMWLKEYIFNLLIQPFHLILYTVLISSAFELASENILYTLVAIGFLMPAEKLLRKFFGFEKAQTPGMLGGAVGASLVMNGMNRLLHGKPPKPPKAGQEGEGKIKESDNLGEITSKEGINNATLFSGDDEDDFSVPINTQQADIQDGSGLPIDSAAEPQGANPRQRMPEPVENAEEGGQTDLEDSDEQTSPTPSTLQTNNQQVSENRNGFMQRHPRARGVLAVGKAYAGQQFKRAIKTSGKIVKKVPKVAAGAAVGAAAGMIGMAAGITSGDISKVTQYTGAGLAGGYALGGSLQEFASGVLTTDEQQLKDAYNRAYYGSEAEYKKAKLKERREKFIKDDQHIKEMQSYLNCSASEAKRVLEDYGDCVDVGITDTKDIAAVSKAVESGWSKEKAMTAAKTLKKAGGEAPGRMGKKAKEDWDFKAANIVKKAGATDVTRAIRQTNKTLDDFVAFKDDLTSI